jgi:hypothetical protein
MYVDTFSPGNLFEKLNTSNILLAFSLWFLTFTQPRPNRRSIDRKFFPGENSLHRLGPEF